MDKWFLMNADIEAKIYFNGKLKFLSLKTLVQVFFSTNSMINDIILLER